jgi:hypothetical protein
LIPSPAKRGCARRIIEAAGGFLEICPIPRDYFARYAGIEEHRIYELDLKEE